MIREELKKKIEVKTEEYKNIKIELDDLKDKLKKIDQSIVIAKFKGYKVDYEKEIVYKDESKISFDKMNFVESWESLHEIFQIFKMKQESEKLSKVDDIKSKFSQCMKYMIESNKTMFTEVLIQSIERIEEIERS